MTYADIDHRRMYGGEEDKVLNQTYIEDGWGRHAVLNGSNPVDTETAARNAYRYADKELAAASLILHNLMNDELDSLAAAIAFLERHPKKDE